MGEMTLSLLNQRPQLVWSMTAYLGLLAQHLGLSTRLSSPLLRHSLIFYLIASGNIYFGLSGAPYH